MSVRAELFICRLDDPTVLPVNVMTAVAVFELNLSTGVVVREGHVHVVEFTLTVPIGA